MFVIFLKIFSEFFVFPILNCEAAQKNNKILKLSDDFSSPCQTRVVGMSRLFFSVRMCRGFEQQMLIRSEPDGEKCEESLRRRWIEHLKSFTSQKKKQFSAVVSYHIHPGNSIQFFKCNSILVGMNLSIFSMFASISCCISSVPWRRRRAKSCGLIKNQKKPEEREREEWSDENCVRMIFGC